MTFHSKKPDIEAVCRECKQEIADGEVPTRSLDVYDDDPDSYCPNCGSDDLKFLPTNEDFPREER